MEKVLNYFTDHYYIKKQPDTCRYMYNIGWFKKFANSATFNE